MSRILRLISRFLVSAHGPTAVEYAVILSLILVTCITITSTLGRSATGTFSTVESTLTGS